MEFLLSCFLLLFSPYNIFSIFVLLFLYIAYRVFRHLIGNERRQARLFKEANPPASELYNSTDWKAKQASIRNAGMNAGASVNAGMSAESVVSASVVGLEGDLWGDDPGLLLSMRKWISEYAETLSFLDPVQKIQFGSLGFEHLNGGFLTDCHPSATFGRKREGKADLVSRLIAEFGLAEEVARETARTLNGRFFGHMNIYKKKNSGLDFYFWSNSGASGTRPGHKALDGKRFHVDFPPVVNDKEERWFPGGDTCCLCWAESAMESWKKGRSLDDFIMNPDFSLTLKKGRK